MWLCTIDFCRGFWYSTLPCPFTFEGAKLLATSTSAVAWYKSRAHTSFLYKVYYMYQLNVTEVLYRRTLVYQTAVYKYYTRYMYYIHVHITGLLLKAGSQYDARSCIVLRYVAQSYCKHAATQHNARIDQKPILAYMLAS